MSKPSGAQTTTTTVDPETAERQRQTYAAAQAAYNNYGNLSGAASPLAMQGLQALGGNQQAINGLMNPYQQNVINQLGQQYDRARTQAALGANDEATRAGAFGGDRQALLIGERQGALDRAQMGDTANLLYQGYGDMLNRANGLVNLGLGIDQNRLNFLNGAMGGPYGQTQSTPTRTNLLGAAAGGAATGGAIGGPIGAGIGAGVGFLGSLF